MKRAFLLLALAGCYRPDTPDKAFKCDAAQNYLCPEAMFCDKDVGLCVKRPAHHDLGFPDMATAYDASIVTAPKTCDDFVRDGALSGLTNLSALNTGGDEGAFAITKDGNRIYYVAGQTTLMTAAMTGSKTAAAPAAVTISGDTFSAINGIAFSADGTMWLAATNATATQIFKLHVDSPTGVTEVDAHQPTGQCAITGLAFTDGDLSKDFYVSYPLAGCNMPEGRTSYVAQGLIDKQMGTFVSAFSSSGYRSPFVVAGGLTLLSSSDGSGARLFYAERPSDDAVWSSPTTLPLGKIGGAGKRDVQAVVSNDCKTMYLLSERTGGQGGLDLWAADLSQ